MGKLGTIAIAVLFLGCASSSLEATRRTATDAGGPPSDGGTMDEPDASAAPDVPDVQAPRCAGPGGTLARVGVTGDRELVMTVDGVARRVLVHAPESLGRTTPSMVVLDFHGFSSAEWQESLLTGMSARADERGFLVVYPQGVATSWNAGDCCGDAWIDAVDDMSFVRALLDRIETEYCVDASRVYATGMSNGGFISHRLACELSDRIAAIAPVAGVLGVAPETCTPARAVPVMQFHGTADPLVPYEGGTPVVHTLGAGIVFRSVAATMEHWRVHNGCADDTHTFFEHGDVTCVEWTGCDAPTRLCTVDGGGHTWPGGLPVPPLGYTTNDLSATDAMLDFFAANPMQ
jgi:polyhydroxybutyrate depolymerase